MLNEALLIPAAPFTAAIQACIYAVFDALTADVSRKKKKNLPDAALHITCIRLRTRFRLKSRLIHGSTKYWVGSAARPCQERAYRR